MSGPFTPGLPDRIINTVTYTDDQHHAADDHLDQRIQGYEAAQEAKADEWAWRADFRYWHYPEGGEPQ